MRRNQIVLGLLLGSITAIYLFAYFLPQTGRISDLKGRLRQVRNEQRPPGEFKARLAAFRQRLDGHAEQLVSLPKQVPDSESSDQFLMQVYILMTEHALRPGTVEPQAPSAHGALRGIPLRLTCEGSFKSVFGFLCRLEALPRISRLTELTLTTPRQSDGDTVQLELKLSIFCLEPEAETAKAPPGSAQEGTG